MESINNAVENTLSKTAAEINNFSLFEFLKPIISAFLILFIGFFIIKKIMPIYRKFLSKVLKDETAEKFLSNLTFYLLKGLVILLALTQLGVETTSLVALLSAVGFAIGLAFQGALSNFAGGILILTQRPFCVGDTVEFSSIKGKVSEITILHTTINTFDNKVISIPNGKISNESITNYTMLPERRVDLFVSASYKENSKKIIEVIKGVVNKNEKVLAEPPMEVVLSSLEDSSVDYAIRAWVKTEDYWDVYYKLLEDIKIEFDERGIEIPYNKLDVNIIK